MTRSLTSGVIAATLFVGSGCATEGDLHALRQDVNSLNANVAGMQLQQVSTADLDSLQKDVKTLGAEIAAVETFLRDSQSDLVKLRARVDEVERVTREMSVSVDALNERVAKLAAAAAPPPVVAAPLPQAPASPVRPSVPRAAPTTISADQAYAAARATFRAREHGQAVLDFLDFLTRYRNHPLAPNAQYWIGEAYYVQRDYRQAIVEFQKVLEFGLSNPKVPDALLKVGLSYRNLRDPVRFRQVLGRVIKDYPSSNAAKIARDLVRTAQAK